MEIHEQNKTEMSSHISHFKFNEANSMSFLSYNFHLLKTWLAAR